jgi:thioesterase domain-containing protein
LFFVPQLTGLYPSTLMAGIMDLARYMDTEQPFYGLQAQALAPELASGTTVSRLDGWHYDRSRFDRIVADCVALMDEVRPGGPYAIGGFCSGSRLSLEIARQLVERGRTVTGVVMLDPPVDIPAIVPATDSVGPLDGLDPELAAMTWYVARDIGWQTGWDLMQMYRALEELPPEKRWDHARDQLVAVGCIPAHVTAAAVRHVFELKAAESQVVRHVLRTIEPRPYDGPVTVLFTEPRRQSVTDQAVEQALQHMRTYLQGSLEVHFIPGDHRTLFEEPHIRVLMEHVNRFLARDRRA